MITLDVSLNGHDVFRLEAFQTEGTRTRNGEKEVALKVAGIEGTLWVQEKIL